MSRIIVSTMVMAMCTVCLFLATVTTPACMEMNYPSVHFNTRQPDFGAPPRSFSIYSWNEPEDRPIGCKPRTKYDYEVEYKRQVRSEARGLAALQRARRLESVGRFTASMPYYRQVLKYGVDETAAITPTAIRDREELCTELTPATDRKLLNAYLTARRDYELSRKGRGAKQMKALANNPHAGILRSHALYVLGAIQYDDKHPNQAATIFERLAKLYPKSHRREAALIMVPRTLLKVPDSEDVAVNAWVGKSLLKKKPVERSRHALQTLLHDYPQTRFRQSALAWLARCDYLQGRRVAALEAYLHQYMTFTGEDDRVSAANSVSFVGDELTPKEAKQLKADLRRNPTLLGDYLEYRLEHGSDAERDLSRLVDLVAGAAGKHQLHLRAKTAARLAQAQYLRGRYREAIVWSNRALSSLPGPGKDLALYVRGASYRKSGRGNTAEANFLQLLHQYPTSYLCGATRENLALLFEHRGRLDLALDQYFRLGYQEDIAYLLDARMTTSQVAAYLNTHPRHQKRNLLVYTLGIRQLRDNQLAKAQATLARLPDRTLHVLLKPENSEYWWNSKYNKPHDPRKTARDLAHLERAISKTHEPNAKAAALYAKASYLYNNRDLLFYNVALWQGGRSTDFSSLWNTGIATYGDRMAVREHRYAHECLYRARALCLQIVRQYKQSPTAPKALYRAACATKYLATFDGWWRNEAVRLHLADDSVRLMKRVYQEYPHDPLAVSARKYAKVFAGERAEVVRNTMFEVTLK